MKTRLGSTTVCFLCWLEYSFTLLAISPPVNVKWWQTERENLNEHRGVKIKLNLQTEQRKHRCQKRKLNLQKQKEENSKSELKLQAECLNKDATE